MIDVVAVAKNLTELKKEFASTCDGTSNILEVIPSSESESFPIAAEHLRLLHLFASANPIYYDSHEEKIGDVVCTVYEGDINRFWLNSIQHGSSRAPFLPTWISSAYVAVLLARDLGAEQVVDIGSGDGRIAYCAGVLGLESHSIEIDGMLADLQQSVSDSTGIDFNPNCGDAVKFDYSALELTRPAFFIGGLAQMGGDILASSVIGNASPATRFDDALMVFAGTYSKKYAPDGLSLAGWGRIIQTNNMSVIKTISLPTAWTFREPDGTPYLFAKF